MRKQSQAWDWEDDDDVITEFDVSCVFFFPIVQTFQ